MQTELTQMLKVTSRFRRRQKTSGALVVSGVIAVILATGIFTLLSGVPHFETLYRRYRIPAPTSLLEERDETGYSAAERLLMEGYLSGACEDWQSPTDNSTRVATGCWKDKWFDQLSGVLNNWEEYSSLS